MKAARDTASGKFWCNIFNITIAKVVRSLKRKKCTPTISHLGLKVVKLHLIIAKCCVEIVILKKATNRNQLDELMGYLVISAIQREMSSGLESVILEYT